MIPVTSVEEEDTVNFHSDLQRPFLRKKQEKRKLVCKTSGKVEERKNSTAGCCNNPLIEKLKNATVSF